MKAFSNQDRQPNQVKSDRIGSRQGAFVKDDM